MSIDWTWLLVGVLVGVFFGSQLRGVVSTVKGKVSGA